MLRTTLLATAATLSLTVSQLASQQLTEGFTATTTSLPAGTTNVLTTDTGRIYFDGFDLTHATNGSLPQSLLTFGSYTFGSFTTPVGATKVLFGESSNGGIWSVPLNGLPPQLIATVPFNYDAVMLDDNRALVSAKTGGFSSPDNDVMFVDLITGQTQLLAQFPGASGPLTVDLGGDVYYATSPAAFPAPAGTVSLLRLTSTVIDSAIAANSVLGVANAQVVIAGLDAASDLAFDDDGDLFFVDWFNNHIGEINDAEGNNATLAPTLINYAGSGLNGSVLQFTRTTAGPQIFEPFQPVAGQLLVHETDYVSISQIRSVTARRPELASSAANPIATGTFSLTTTNGPANGIGLLAFATTVPAGPLNIQVPGFEQPLLIDAAFSASPVLVPLTFGNTGVATLTVQNPGFAPILDATTQTICFAATGALGTSQALPLQIGQ
ncbi:MAG: hypothetical protein ACI89X_002000 [Planctomycetota bacterium]|jgi:hypothetical protein